ncbi:MAG: serine/threonine protein kinase [Chloroflexi bacterium]|nr:serine/threonine protein kinase [Chloroflexota bacterium]
MTARQKLSKPFVFTTTFATYTATHIIGEGGSGRIFEANDDAGGMCAIKWLDPAKATKEKVKRFKNELQFCIRNKHHNILTIVDHGVFIEGESNSPFYIMPLYDRSLRDLLKDGISPDKVLNYFAQILDGVEAAHIQGVVHRDLKPENILYAADNDRLVIADFGIARFEEDELYTAVETKDSTRLANFQYAAPEQRSRGIEPDQRADIYALGLILNEMFTGEVPSGTGYKTIAKVTSDYEYLDSVVEEMMRHSPEDRIDSIERIKNELIGRKNKFITRQRISELKGTVIPVTELDDPLIADPPRLVNADWDHGILTLFFQRPVNEKWVWALQNMGSYTSLAGKGPTVFKISGDKAVIDARENQVQQIIEYFMTWLPQANRVYEQRIREEKEQAEEKQRKELERQIAEQEARQRVLKNIKLNK